MLLACVLVGGIMLFAKMLGRGAVEGDLLHPLQISAGRFLFAWITLLPVFLWLRPSIRGAAWGLNIGRALCGWGSATTLFAAAALMPLADATAISFLSPVVTLLLAIPLLHERVGPWRFGAAIVALGGAWILTGAGTSAFQVAALIALAAACFMGLESILIKKLTGIDRALTIMFIGNSVGVVFSMTAASFVWVPPSLAQWMLLAAIGLSMAAVQGLFLLAMRRSDASFVVPFWYLTLVFAAGFDFLVFEILPGLRSLTGAALIIVSALVLAWRESARARMS